ncbi:tetraspanin-3-like [Cryptomeria japonica]|uniref:tetraspanin-3-like n=1 Tax=Cryptomeria japonica TaxID=3369 RepID=UPI0027DA75DD|nr:tetraspanin-3-like [Cryptomeria japonica]
MFRATNSIVGLLNFVTFLLSIPILGGGIWLATRNSGNCLRFLQWPIIVIGSAIMLLSLAGFVGACFRVTSLLWLYLFFMLLLILAYLGCIIFAFAVTGKGEGHPVINTGFSEYKLQDFSHWMQDRVRDSGSWHNIRSCVRDAKVCKKLGDKTMYMGAAGFYQQHLNPFQMPSLPLAAAVGTPLGVITHNL